MEVAYIPPALFSVSLVEQCFRAPVQLAEVVPKLAWLQACRASMPVLLSGLGSSATEPDRASDTTYPRCLGYQESIRTKAGNWEILEQKLSYCSALSETREKSASHHWCLFFFFFPSSLQNWQQYISVKPWYLLLVMRWTVLLQYNDIFCNVETILILLLASSTLWSLTSASPNSIMKRCEESIM